MKDFDINLARKGHPVCRRDGKPARIICFDRISAIGYPIIALVLIEDSECAETYATNGRYSLDNPTPHEYDLMMATTKHEGWVNVYSFDKKHYSTDSRIHLIKEDAINSSSGNDRLIATVKIEWEE